MNREVNVLRWTAEDDPDEVRQAIADALFMNFDAELNLLYFGEDKNNGIEIKWNGSGLANLQVKPFCNGATLGNTPYQLANRMMAYVVNDTKTAAAFGANVSELTFGYSDAVDASGTHTHVFFCVYNVGNAFAGVWGNDQNYATFRSDRAMVISTKLFGVCPIALNNESTVIATDGYFQAIGDGTAPTTAKFVSMNGEDYMLLSAVNAGQSRPVLHLGRS